MKRNNKKGIKVKKKKLAGRLAALVLSLTVGFTMVQKPRNAFAADGGSVLSDAELSSSKLVNPNRDYLYRVHHKDVQSVVNVDNLYDYVVMPNLPGEEMPDTSHLKYLVIHETSNVGPTATAVANYSSMWKNMYNSTWFVDEDTVVQGTEMNISSRTIGDTDYSKSDVGDDVSINIEMCVNNGADYMKTVANTIHLVRLVLKDYPHLKLARHYDAFSERYNGVSTQKLCPRLMLTEMSWWTWDRFVFFATNPNLPIPFIDFNPEESSEIPASLKGLDIMKERVKNEPIVRPGDDDFDFDLRDMLALMPGREKWYGYDYESNSQSLDATSNIEETEKPNDISEEVADVASNSNENIVAKNQDTNVINEADAVLEKNEKKAASNTSMFIFDNDMDSDDFLVFNQYIDLNIEEMEQYIKTHSQGVKYTDTELNDILVAINFACKMESFNPYIAIEMMNQYTGFLHFGGQAQPEYYNFGGLENKDGVLIQYKNIEEGAIAYIQFLKYLTSKDKLKLSCDNTEAIKAVKSRGKVNNLGDMTRALGVSEGFISSIVNRVKNIA